MGSHVDKIDFKDFFPNNQSALTDYAVEYEKKGKTKFYECARAGCFGMFKYNSGFLLEKDVIPKFFYMGLRCKKEVTQHRDAWYNYIFSPTLSPWRDLLKNEGFEYQYLDSAQPAYVKVPITKDTNMQMIISFLIAARLGTDAPQQLNMFGELVKAKWKPHEALYTSIYVGLMPSDKKATVSGMTYDWFAFSAHNNNDLEKFKAGKPWLSTNQQLGKPYGPLARMWYKDENSLYNLKRENIDFYVRTDSLGSYNGKFKGLYREQNKSMELKVASAVSLDFILSNKNKILGIKTTKKLAG